MVISTLLTLAAVVACTIAFPVVQNCTTPPDLFAYCNKSVNNTEPRESLAMLYKESNIIITLLEDRVCNKTVYICGIDCNVPKVSLTDDRDEQNDAVYSQLRTLHKQLLLLDDHCTTENSTEDNTTTKLCETFQTGVHHLIQQITDYLEMEKCGCDDHCNYSPSKVYKKPEEVPVEQLPCKFYNTVSVANSIIGRIQGQLS